MHFPTREERPVPVAKITGQGLFAIGCAVALLWICFVAERVMMARAYAERADVMRSLEPLQRKRSPHPVSDPVPFRHRIQRAVG